MSEVTIRRATAADSDWLGNTYRAAGFIAADPTLHYVVVAEVRGVPAGTGRVMQYDDALELGGIYVVDAFRGSGISRLIVGHLVNIYRSQLLYCIPFAKLTPLYASYGFVPVSVESAPESISTKFRWCVSHYAAEVRLLRRNAER